MPSAIKRHIPALLQAKPKTLKQRKGNRTLALNNAAWRRLRESVLRDEPLCRRCAAEGRLVPATDVDHIDNDAGNNQRANLQSLCHSCHSIKTNEDMHARKIWGCDEDGYPFDSMHEWNMEK